jgi:branched-chain amino acid aminotransferase
MFVPIDDHQVHRGDAVFEAMKVIRGNVYLSEAHLDRLARSAQAISLEHHFTRDFITDVIKQTLQASGLESAIVRLFLSRGPGSFSPNPYDTLGAQLYIVITELQNVSMEKINHGVKVGLSKISPKESWLAQVKSCNYLHNVLMKKEAVDRNLDFTIGVTKDGLITEGSTENIIILDDQGHLLKPKRENILLGTTMQRAFELSKSITEVQAQVERDLDVNDLASAKEIMMVGTTLDVVSVTEYEGQKVGSGQPGPVALKLRELLLKDQL